MEQPILRTPAEKIANFREAFMSSVTFATFYFNRASEVGVTVDSMLVARTNDTHVIVVNDGSTDDTSTELARFVSRGIQIINQENKGFTHSLVDAFSNVDTEYLGICGSGDICHPQRLARQVELMDARPDIVFCGTASRNIDPNSGSVVDIQDFHEGELFARDFFESPPFTHGTVLIRNSAYKAVGGYDRRFLFSQDWDLWLRLLSVGKGYFINECLYDRRALSDGASFSAKKAEQQLLFKYAALHLHKKNQLSRDEVLDGLASHGGAAIPDARRFMRRDLSTRYIKVLFTPSSAQAAEIKEILEDRYGGLPIQFLAISYLVKFLKKTGVDLALAGRLARWVINKYRGAIH